MNNQEWRKLQIFKTFVHFSYLSKTNDSTINKLRLEVGGALHAKVHLET
ncbi:MAG: hypothetical protein MI866_21075 [Bacteroidales bacterium]|nr:hypothetical protein [Bacteroidales bacterium]